MSASSKERRTVPALFTTFKSLLILKTAVAGRIVPEKSSSCESSSNQTSVVAGATIPVVG